MVAKQQRRRITPRPSPEPEIGRVFADGTVHELYRSLDEADRRDIVFAVGVKNCQRIGHRHRLIEFRELNDIASEWAVVDSWLLAAERQATLRSFGDLFGPLLTELVGRAVEILGDNSDAPTAEQLREMGEELAFERSWPQVRLLMAGVVELGFEAEAEARSLSESDERFRIPA